MLKNTFSANFKFTAKPTRIEVLNTIKSKIKGRLRWDAIALDFYSTDGSIFEIRPLAIFYPKDIYDIQIVLNILNAATERGTIIPLIPRGRGTDQGGAPLGEGIIIEFYETLNQILEIGENFVRVQPGVRYGELQKMLKERGKYLPPYPASFELCTIGGAIANNSAGEKTLKYGSTRDFVISLKIMLANGDIIDTYPLERRELDHKKKQSSFEGKIYHELTHILNYYKKAITESRPHTSKNSSGYDVWNLDKRGEFDLSQLLVGSQGTLGIVLEASLKIVDAPKKLGLITGYFENIDSASQAVMELLHLKPSALELADRYLIELVNKHDPSQLKGLLPKKMPALVILCEFDNEDQHQLAKNMKLGKLIMAKHAFETKETYDPDEQARLWKVRRSAAMVMWTITGKKKALPIIEDGTVHASLLAEFLNEAYRILKKYNLTIAVWGHAGDADLHMQPFMDLSKKEDREKVFKVMDEFYAIVKELEGTATGEHNDGIIRTPYLELIYGKDMIKLFKDIKNLFDPFGLINPGKKVGMTTEEAKKLVRHSYSLENLISDRQLINR